MPNRIPHIMSYSPTRRRLSLILCLVASLFLTATVSFAQNECNILGTPTTTTGSIAATDTLQTNRLFRDGRGTTCQFNRAATQSAGTPFRSDSYNFTNTNAFPICVFVDLDATGCGVATNQISMAAYTTYNPASILTGLIADPGLSTGQNFATSMAFTVPAMTSYTIVVHNININTTCASYTFTKTESTNCRLPGFDLDDDGQTDLTVVRVNPSGEPTPFQTLLNTLQWYSYVPEQFNKPGNLNGKDQVSGDGDGKKDIALWRNDMSAANFELLGPGITVNFGIVGDIPTPGDYLGNEITRWALFRPSNGTWYTSLDPLTNFGAFPFGINGDIPVQGDYERDGITDFAVYRPSTNTFHVRLSSAPNNLIQLTLGVAGDKPVPADYDGDGKMDFAVYRPSNGLWTVLGSAGRYGSVTTQQVFGISSDIPVPADYDGDGKADLAVFRQSEGNWYIFRSSLTAGQLQVVKWGVAGDIPQPADYDDDLRADQAVFRPSTGEWYLNRSTLGFFSATWGVSGDIPTSAPNPNTNQ